MYIYIYVCTYGGWFPIMCFIYGWSMDDYILGEKRKGTLPAADWMLRPDFVSPLMGTSESDSLICWVHPLRKGYLNPIESHIKSHQSVKFHGSIRKMALIEPFLFGPSSPQKMCPNQMPINLRKEKNNIKLMVKSILSTLWQWLT